MDREQATSALMSTMVDERLKAARYLSKTAEAIDGPLILRALAKENARWVKRALERAMDRIQKGPTDFTTVIHEDTVSDNDPEQLAKDMRAQAVDEVSRTILHEFSPLIGSLRLVAEVEVTEYASSTTKHCIERLDGLLEAVGNLKQAASTPSYSEFDLSELIGECVAVLNISDTDVVLRLAGVRPYMVQADRESLGLAIDNGIRNALESVSDFSTTEPAEILINWGPAGLGNWLAILDSGAGFTSTPEEAFKLGASNKAEHFGYGLSIAQLSMRAMEGDVYISNKADGGARFELRWYRDYADITR